MNVNELSAEMKGHDRYQEFLTDLEDHGYPKPGTPEAEDYDINDQFEYFWRRVAGGEDLSLDDYLE